MASSRPHRAWVVWAAAGAAFALAAALPLPDGLSRQGAYAIAALAAAIVLWASGVQDPALSGLLLLTLLSVLGVLPFPDAVAGLGTEFVWLLVVTFILAEAMAHTGLGRRIALVLLHRAGGRPDAVLLAVLGSAVILAFVVPTAAGRASMIVPVCLGIVEAAGLGPGSRLATAMLLGTSFASVMAGVGIMTAAGATVYAAGAFARLAGWGWSYSGWLAAFFPLVVVFVLVVWRLLLALFPPERVTLAGGAAYVEEQLRRRGALSPGERRVLAAVIVMFALWVVGPRWHVTTAQAGMIGVLPLLLPGLQVLTWERALAAVRWNVIILFGVALALAEALDRSGASHWLTAGALAAVPRPTPVATALILTPVVLLARIGFVNNLGMIAAGLPLAFTLARGWGLNPVWVGMLVVMTAGPGFVLPTQTPTGMITAGYQMYTMRDHMRAGMVASAVLLVLTWCAALVYWPLLGYGP
ncbi:MAG: SLC13 family permease [Armatimonadota bacterium]|nr:SLC13 family permease [Armatimonadota bacterium]